MCQIISRQTGIKQISLDHQGEVSREMPRSSTTDQRTTSRKPREKPTYKIIVLGSGGVGKSAITIQFVKSFFFSDYDPTIEDSYVKQCLIDHQIAHLEILDSAGQEEFKPMREQYIRVGEGFLLVFSLTDRRSLDDCTKLHRDILRIKDAAHVPMLLVGNKCDLPSTGVDIQARAAAATLQIPYFETSARARLNIDEAFVELVRIIRKNKTPDHCSPSRPSTAKEHRQLAVCYSCAIL